MSPSTRLAKATGIAYVIFCLLVLADVSVTVFSETHMNAYGNIHGGGDLLIRILPDACLLIFYSYSLYSLILFGRVMRLAVLVHSGVFAVVGLGLAIPFMGLILSQFTPVGLIYRLLMLHQSASSAYRALVALAIAFSVFNLGLFIVAFRGK
jgi:hypothetical protein